MTKLECEIEYVKGLIERLDTESHMAVLKLLNLCDEAIDLLAELDVAEPQSAWAKRVHNIVSEWGVRIKACGNEPADD